MRREWTRTENNIKEAIDYVWDKQIVLLIYPEEMDLVVAHIWTEDFCYLKHTLVIDSTSFDTKEEFEKAVQDYL